MADKAIADSREPFRLALGNLLRERGITDSMGNPNLHAFAQKVEEIHYESLRRVVAGERPVTPRIMELCAKAAGVKPTYFAEYRLHEAQRQFDVREVGVEKALENLDRWATRAAANAGARRRQRA